MDYNEDPEPPNRQRDEWREMYLKAERENADLRARLAALESALAQARAEAAGMREALNELRCKVTRNPCGTDTWAVGHPCDCPPCREYVKAIATDAGKKLLDRLAKAEAVVDRVRAGTCCDRDGVMNDETRQVLAAYDASKAGAK